MNKRIFALLFSILFSACAGCTHRTVPNIAPPAASAIPISVTTAPTSDQDAHIGAAGHHSADEDHHHDHFLADGTLVTNHGIPLFRETQAFKWSPEERAQKVTARLNMIATTHGLEADSVFMRRVGGLPTVFFYHHHGPGSEGHILATVDPKTAAEFGYGSKPETLAYWWRDVLRDHALLIQGEAPRWTTRYAPPLQQLHQQLQRQREGVPSHAAFDAAIEALPPSELATLKSLYVSVPANYRPQPDDVHAVKAAHHHDAHSGEDTDADHDHADAHVHQ